MTPRVPRRCRSPRTQTGYWCFAGFYSGDSNYVGSSDTTTDECFDVTTGTASSATTTTPASSSIVLGYGNSDSAVVSGNATYGSPTGTVTFYECGPTASPEPCTSQANPVGSPVGVTAGANDTSSASSESFTPNSDGYWCFAGHYFGDSNYAVSSDTTTDECFDVIGPSISNVEISKKVKTPKVTISGSGFGTVANLGSPRAACGSSPTGLDYWNHFLFDDTTDGWSAGEGSPTYDCIGVIIKSYSNEQVVFTFGSDYGRHNRTGSGKALLNSGDQFTMTLLGASFSGTADYTTGAPSATTTTPASSSIVIGNGNSDSAVVSGNATYGSPTGTVTFYECGPTASPEPCTSQANPVGSPVGVTAGANDTSNASSVSFTPNSGGYWCFAGFYSGDSNYAESSDTTTDECFDVTTGTAPSATTTTPASSSVVLGNANSDSAVVSGNATYGSPTGSVTFYECGPTASPEPCTSQANQVGSPVGVTAGANDTSSASSVSFTPNSGGYWCFAGYYFGDSNYAGSSDTTTDECFDVIGPYISTVQISKYVKAPKVTISGSGFGTVANLGTGTCGLWLPPEGTRLREPFPVLRHHRRLECGRG